MRRIFVLFLSLLLLTACSTSTVMPQCGGQIDIDGGEVTIGYDLVRGEDGTAIVHFVFARHGDHYYTHYMDVYDDVGSRGWDTIGKKFMNNRLEAEYHKFSVLVDGKTCPVETIVMDDDLKLCIGRADIPAEVPLDDAVLVLTETTDADRRPDPPPLTLTIGGTAYEYEGYVTVNMRWRITRVRAALQLDEAVSAAYDGTHWTVAGADGDKHTLYFTVDGERVDIPEDGVTIDGTTLRFSFLIDDHFGRSSAVLLFAE